MSYCSPSKKKSRADILEMENLVKIIGRRYRGQYRHADGGCTGLYRYCREMINHNPDSLYPKKTSAGPVF
ncbi:hypothetical protein [Klebsiella pneumoniae]|uniref:hypothetical protein n=1 Tax=Klebsiella pneumoniae TaxID=573 RepID=UPI00388E67D5